MKKTSKSKTKNIRRKTNEAPMRKSAAKQPRKASKR
jgi:hypothetical protein